jgi:sugar transferase (PEP-CTERM/EpsH1 system associated)
LRQHVAHSARPLVVHLIHRLAVGGLENGLVNLINATSAEVRHGVICVTDFTSYAERLDPSVPVVALNKRAGKDLKWYGTLRRALATLQPDILHTRNFGTLEGCVVAAAAGVRRRVHGEHGWDMPDPYGTSRKRLVLRRLADPFVSRYIAVSQDLAAWLVGRIGLESDKVTQVYNGVDCTRFSPVPRDGRATVTIGTVIGQFRPVKDPLNLVRAYLALRADPALAAVARLRIVGDGPLREQIATLLLDGGVAPEEVLVGTRRDVEAFLREIDVYVLPSLNEGISNTILEAMASGLPVVATNVGGNKELVVDGVTGSLVPPVDSVSLAAALGRYCNEPELRRAHGAAARDRALGHFSMESMARAYLHVYEQLLGG